MNLLRQLYDWSERTFWNSLPKKLMSFLLLFLIDVGYLAIYIRQKDAIAAELSRAQVAPELLAKISSSLDGGLTLMLVLTAVALCWNVLQVLYLRFLILRPVRVITTIFDEIARGEGDFSRNLPTMTHDELRTLAVSYNRFADKMREIIGEVRKMSVNIAREAVVVKKTVASTALRARQQGEIADAVFGASNEATQAIQEVSRSADQIANSTDANLETARASLHEMHDIVSKVQAVSVKLSRFNETVGHLAERSDSIRQIAGLIKDIADQTNLLALNAAIEAARAGEMGRGFAVVADEVRKLAERTASSTTEIAQMINTMQGKSDEAAAGVGRAVGSMEDGVKETERARQTMQQIAVAADDSKRVVGEIASAIREQGAAANSIAQQVETVAQMSEENASAAHSVTDQAQHLNALAATLDREVRLYKL